MSTLDPAGICRFESTSNILLYECLLERRSLNCSTLGFPLRSYSVEETIYFFHYLISGSFPEVSQFWAKVLTSLRITTVLDLRTRVFLFSFDIIMALCHTICFIYLKTCLLVISFSFLRWVDT